VKGLLTLVESSSRRFFAEFTLSAGRRLFASLRVTASEGLRMTRGGFFNNPSLRMVLSVFSLLASSF